MKKIFLIVGRPGVGKSEFLQHVLKTQTNNLSVKYHSTRAKRPEEKALRETLSLIFATRADFDKLNKTDNFVFRRANDYYWIDKQKLLNDLQDDKFQNYFIIASTFDRAKILKDFFANVARVKIILIESGRKEIVDRLGKLGYSDAQIRARIDRPYATDALDEKEIDETIQNVGSKSDFQKRIDEIFKKEKLC